jgi:hypothetical protein
MRRPARAGPPSLWPRMVDVVRLEEENDLFGSETLGESADFRIPRCTFRGMKRVLYLVAAFVAAAVCATASASGPYTAKSVPLNARNPSAAFSRPVTPPSAIPGHS